jgi:hypothetical protein
MQHYQSEIAPAATKKNVLQQARLEPIRKAS